MLRNCLTDRLPRVRFLEVEEHAAVAINLEAEFTRLCMIGAKTGAAIGAYFRTHPPTEVTVAVMNNLDTTVSDCHKTSKSSQTRAQVSHPA